MFASGWVLLIENYANENTASSNTDAPVAFGSAGHVFLTMYSMEFFAKHFACDQFGHVSWGVKKPITVRTVEKALIHFFRKKLFPPKLWNICDQILQFIFVFVHVPGVKNPTAYYLPRLDKSPTDSIHLKLTDSIPI